MQSHGFAQHLQHFINCTLVLLLNKSLVYKFHIKAHKPNNIYFSYKLINSQKSLLLGRKNAKYNLCLYRC